MGEGWIREGKGVGGGWKLAGDRGNRSDRAMVL